MDDTVTISSKEYHDLVCKAHGFKLRDEMFTKLRNMITPKEEDKVLPFYDMLYKCIKDQIELEQLDVK